MLLRKRKASHGTACVESVWTYLIYYATPVQCAETVVVENQLAIGCVARAKYSRKDR